MHLLRSEVQALRAENAQLKKGHAEIIQRLLAESPGSSPSDVVIALKREFGVVFDDTDAYNLLMQHGFNPNDVREVTGADAAALTAPLQQCLFRYPYQYMMIVNL